MSESQRVDVYDSQSSAYQRSFQVFLDHTNQKAVARDWLTRRVEALSTRQMFIDAGAGNGKVTGWVSDRFERTVAIEPNPYLAGELRHVCPAADVLATTILDAHPPAPGDLVLCSHVFYYIDRSSWLSNLERLASWIAPGGVLVVVLQNHDTDCMRMLEHFHGERFDLSNLTDRFQAVRGDRYAVHLETVPAEVVTPGFDAAYTVAEFMLNLLPMPNPPAWAALEAYVRREFAAPGGGDRFSCDQDFLQIVPR
jgi:hypothetical protein